MKIKRTETVDVTPAEYADALKRAFNFQIKKAWTVAPGLFVKERGGDVGIVLAVMSPSTALVGFFDLDNPHGKMAVELPADHVDPFVPELDVASVTPAAEAVPT